MVEWSIEALRGAASIGGIVVAAPPGAAEHTYEFTGEDLFVVAGGEARARNRSPTRWSGSRPIWSRSTTRRGRW